MLCAELCPTDENSSNSSVHGKTEQNREFLLVAFTNKNKNRKKDMGICNS
jgi:hypothetical protein